MLPPPGDEAMSRWMFESSPDCVKLLDLEGNLLEINGSGRCAMEIDDFDAICGNAWATLWPEESRDDIAAAVGAALKGYVGRFQAFCPTAKGTPKWWDVTVTPILDSSGAPAALLSLSRDVTALVKAQKEARETAARLRFVLDAAKIGEWELDLATLTAHRSARHDQCFGYVEPLAQWSYDLFLSHVHSGDRDRVNATFEQAVRSGSGLRFECRVVWPDQTIHWISVHGSQHRPEPGKPGRMLGTVLDITEHKMALALAEGQKQALEMAVTGAPLERVLEALARSAEASSGSDAYASVLVLEDGRRLRHGAAPSLPPAYTAAIDGVEIGPNVGSCGTAAYLAQPVVVTDVTTDPRWADYRPLAAEHGLRACWSQPIFSSAGEVLGTVAAYHKHPHEPLQRERVSMALLANTAALVLERHRANQDQLRTRQALQASEQRFRSLVEVTASIVWTTNAEGEFEKPQAGWRAYTGQDDAGAAGWGWLDCVHPEDRDRTVAGVREALAHGTVCELEHRVRRRDGASRFMSMRAVPIRDPAGAIQEWVGIHVDITSIRQAEQDLRRLAGELSEANSRQTEFLATLAHELRNPLAPIRNALELLRLAGDKPAAIGRLRELMTRQVKHMVHLVDDLLDVARISRGKLVLKKEQVKLDAVVSAAVEASLPLIEAKCHELVIEAGEPVLLDADPTRMTQVISNLLNNAAKYTPSGGRIRLYVERQGGSVSLSVTDNGIGLSKDSLESVFEMFAQVGSPTERSQGGLGIGLTLARKLTELHGGKLVADSPGPGRGSTFSVHLPIMQADSAGAERGLDQDVEPAFDLRVLVIDDNVDAGETLAALVEVLGCRVRTASDGPNGLAVAREFRPEVAFVDIGMPGMDGYEVARALRQMPETRRGTLVALTGWGSREDQERAFEAGFDRHLTKPVDPQGIREVLASAAAGSA